MSRISRGTNELTPEELEYFAAADRAQAQLEGSIKDVEDAVTAYLEGKEGEVVHLGELMKALRSIERQDWLISQSVSGMLGRKALLLDYKRNVRLP